MKVQGLILISAGSKLASSALARPGGAGGRDAPRGIGHIAWMDPSVKAGCRYTHSLCPGAPIVSGLRRLWGKHGLLQTAPQGWVSKHSP